MSERKRIWSDLDATYRLRKGQICFSADAPRVKSDQVLSLMEVLVTEIERLERRIFDLESALLVVVDQEEPCEE